jgi:hypothetical protein
MRIAFFGYYNFLNAGDDRIQSCLKRIFAGHILVFLPHFEPIPPLSFLNTFDWLIIGGGGLIRERVGIWVNMASWLKSVRANVGVVGLGVNSLTPELAVEVSSLIKYAQFFFVRDQQSKQLLNNDPKVEVYPDLTWCFPLSKTCYQVDSQENNQSNFSDVVAINLTPGITQPYEPEKWIEQCKHLNLIPFPLYFTKNNDYWLLKQYFQHVPEEFDLQPLIQSKFLLACRFHAIAFAMQLGKPLIGINYDDKVRRLLIESNLSELCLEVTEHNLLPEKINYLAANQVIIQQKIATYGTQQTQLAQVMLQKLNYYLQNTPLKEHPRTVWKRKIKQVLKIT